MIEVSDLTRRYGDFAAVNNVSFTIHPGEVVGLLGHNGAGKTTIMKMLTGYLEPSSGTVALDGIDVWSDPQRVQEQMGYLPENSPLYPELSVVEYLSYAAKLRGLVPEECVGEAISATALQEKVLEPIATLSRGYKQRVGVAQAILNTPKFLILDEPSNGLDPTQIQHMRDLIRRLAEHATIILSTHIMQEVSAVCDRVIILRDGEVAVDERLDALQGADGLRLTTRKDLVIDSLLTTLDCVSSIIPEAAGVWQIGVVGSEQVAASEIAKSLVSAGFPIYGLTPQVRDLEVVFKEVNDAT